MNKQEIIQRILIVFTSTLAVACIGIYMGQYIPKQWMLPLMIIEIIMLIAAALLRRKSRVGYIFLFSFVVISGITMFPAIYYYVSEIGAVVVLFVFLLTLMIFTILGMVGWVLQKDLSFMGSTLFIILIVLIAFSIFNWFIPQSDTVLVIVACISAGLFSVYIVYDFNQIKHRALTAKDVPSAVLSLYLDFVNLFLHLLRIISYVFKNRG
ncbi:Bax inhibitor-1/YccA family protein [Oceanobacillus iheyensis]|uniref:Bax inhibitor-1/YccA family protein n=1 Tax=Oceanobacillus iheyensis TaxID=182710 RepID=UPI0036373683